MKCSILTWKKLKLLIQRFSCQPKNKINRSLKVSILPNSSKVPKICVIFYLVQWCCDRKFYIIAHNLCDVTNLIILLRTQKCPWIISQISLKIWAITEDLNTKSCELQTLCLLLWAFFGAKFCKLYRLWVTMAQIFNIDYFES